MQPDATLVIDYGQRPARAEAHAARAVASELQLPLSEVQIDCSPIGSGLLAGEEPSPVSSAPEWWPFRNQLLSTIAAAWALPRGFDSLLLGSVSGDAERHLDGRPEFYAGLSDLLALQEGGLRVEAPALHLSATELIRHAGAEPELLGWTHSCHRANRPCAACPGCQKRREIYDELGWI
jgi:7-cyano-7-deazaguanine synthase